MAVAADRPATGRRAVAFCCDEGYLPYALLAASQVAALAPGRDFDILICGDPAPPVPASLEGLGLRRCSIDTRGRLAGLWVDARRTGSAYLRLALPEALAGDYDRILYLDSDVFVQGGDFGALLGAELGGFAVAAVRDNIQWRTPGRRPEEFRRFGWPAAPYLNSGLLLIDVPAFVSGDLLGRAVAMGRGAGDRLIALDQTLLNCLLRGDWAELSPVWNWQYTRASRLFEAMEGAHVVHFIGRVKPWNDPAGDLPPRFAEATAAFLAAHFPDRDRPAPRSGPARSPAAMRRVLWRHLLAAGRMADYLGRFPTDLTVRTGAAAQGPGPLRPPRSAAPRAGR